MQEMILGFNSICHVLFHMDGKAKFSFQYLELGDFLCLPIYGISVADIPYNNLVDKTKRVNL